MKTSESRIPKFPSTN